MGRWAKVRGRGRLGVATIALVISLGASVVLAVEAQPAASASEYLPVPLPAGIGVLYGIQCPAADSCYAVGSTNANGGGVGVVATSRDGGRTWSAMRVQGTVNLAGIACSSPTHCVAVGAADAAPPSAAVAVTRDGHNWQLAPVPSGSNPAYRVSCPTSTDCLAVGDQNALQGLMASTDGGATWVTRPVPQTASGPAAVFSVSCVDSSHCWVVGGGAWETTDLGATWTDRSPPQPSCPAGRLVCDASYSLLDGVSFVDSAHGWVVGGIQCGGVGRTQCPSAVVATSDGGSHWTSWSAADQNAFPFIDDISCAGNACVAVAQTVTDSELMTTTDGVHWSAIQKFGGFLSGVTCPRGGSCFAVGVAGGSAVLLSSTVPLRPAGRSAPDSGRSLFSLSLLDPRDVSTDPRLLATNGLTAFLVALLIVFPSNLFNSTMAANYDEVMGWMGPLRTLMHAGGRAAARAPDGAPHAPRVLFLVAAALIAGLLDPGFGLNGHSVLIFTGMLGAITFGTLVTGRLGAFYVRRRKHVNHRLHLYPAGLLVGLACVLISRAAHFLPGYLYGVVTSARLERDLDEREEGRTLAVAFAGTFVISLVAWLAWLPIKDLANQHSLFLFTALDVLLAAIFVGGIEGMLFGLIPIRYQPGEKLRNWSRPVWLLYLLISFFTLFHVLLRPRPTDNLTPFITVLSLFLLFGGCSVAFWAYFRYRPRRPTAHTAGASVRRRAGP